MLKMCDFGYSKDEEHQSISKSTCGTPEYMAPEVLVPCQRKPASLTVTRPLCRRAAADCECMRRLLQGADWTAGSWRADLHFPCLA